MTLVPRGLWRTVFGYEDPPLPLDTLLRKTEGGVRVEFSTSVTYLEMSDHAAFELGRKLIFISKGIEI